MKILDKVLRLIFPKTCLSCNKIIADGEFCADDWKALCFLQKPACNICFSPFEFHVADDAICGSCAQNRPEYFKAISVLKYDEFSGKLISNFKYFDQTHLTKYFSKIMNEAAQHVLPDIDYIAPVPLHKFKIIKRKYNQSALLAKQIAFLNNKKLLLNLLIRSKNSKAQAGLQKNQRLKNVVGIFRINQKFLDKVKDKNILLIDDVITTGATVNQCAKVLKKSGVNRVYVLTLAKTVI